MVLLDALRLRDEWAQIHGERRDLNDAVVAAVDIEAFRTRRAAVEGTTGMRPHELERIFTLADGRLSARRVIDLSRMGTFQGGRALVGLLREGLITLARRSGVDGLSRSVQAARERPVVGYAVLGVCAVLATLLLRLPSPRGMTDYPIPEDAVEQVRAAATTERLRAVLEAYRWAHGGCTVLAPLPVDQYSYSRTAEGYTLRRKLP
jgi:hypothetical protein